MLFMVEQADHYKSFADYGLPIMAVTYNDEILTDIEEIEASEEVSFRFSEIEINTIEELMEFIKRVGCRIVVGNNDEFFDSLKKKYKRMITLYNDYLE